MSENSVLRRTFSVKWKEVTGELRKLYSDELHGLYTSPNIRVVKSRRIGWAGHIA